jgi:hypothetical protein
MEKEETKDSATDEGRERRNHFVHVLNSELDQFQTFNIEKKIYTIIQKSVAVTEL